MDIVIENDPYRPSSTSPAPTYLRSPVSGQQPVINTNSAFYYATLPRGAVSPSSRVPPEAPDGAPITTSVRRVDKSGLLEISDIEPPTRLCNDTIGTLSRRIERSGLLEAVPEVPDQCHRIGGSLASDELLAAAATARSMVERQQHLLGAETDIVESALLRRRVFAASSGQELKESLISKQNENETNANNNNNNPTRSTPRVKFATDECTTVINSDEIKEQQQSRMSSVVDCLSKLSPRQRNDRITLSNIPDVIETATTQAPEGERAEAEGCEHTNIESLEEARVSFKGNNTTSTTSTANTSNTTGNTKLSHNDNNLQAVHVIILSEQL